MLKFNNGKTLVPKFNNLKILVPSRMKLLFLNSEWKEMKINCKVYGARLFSEFHRDSRDRTRGNWHTLKLRRYPVNIKILFFFSFFSVRVTEHWGRLKILEIFRSCLDTVQVKLLEVTVPEQEVEQDNVQQSPPTSNSPQFWNAPCSDFPRTLCLCLKTLFQSSKFVTLCLSGAAVELLSSFPQPWSTQPWFCWVRTAVGACPGPDSAQPCVQAALVPPGWPAGTMSPHGEPSNSAGLQGGNSRAMPNNSCHRLISSRDRDSLVPQVCLFGF